MEPRRDQFLLIVLDADVSSKDHAEIMRFIKEDDGISAWWHHMKPAYIVRTQYDPDDITDNILNILDVSRFIVVNANMGEINGWVPEKAWSWIRKQTRKYPAS